MTSPILHATDFSLESEKALTYALELARMHDVKLIMLHVYNTQSVLGKKEQIPEEAIIKQMEEVKALYAFRDKVKVEYLAIHDSSVTRGILQTIQETQPAMLVVGADESNISKEIISGSTIMKLIKKSTIPVLAIPENLNPARLKHIVYATDIFEKDIWAIQQLLSLTQPFQPQITVVHVTGKKESDESKEKLQWFKELINEKLGAIRIDFQRVVADDIHDGLITIIKEDEFDLLVMMEKERKGILDKIFHQDLVNKMQFDLPIPLLSFNESNL